MKIYQVIDDEDQFMYESFDAEQANLKAESLNLTYEERYFFVEEAELTVH